jgi:lipopolysaccharide export system protein LptA
MSFRIVPLLACLCFAPCCFAEKADRDKPLQVEAQRLSIDDAKKVQILEGDVVLTKGTLILRAERVIITEDQYGFQKSTAFAGKSGLAHFRQKREGRDDYIDGEAERIEYNTANEVAELFHRAWIKGGEDQVKGDYIWYDAISEKYLATAGDNRDPKAPPARVRAIIQPKNKTPVTEAATPKNNSLELRGASGLGSLPERE